MKVKVNGKFFLYFTDVTISTLLINLASTFAITATFDPDNPDHRTLFQPLLYPTVQFYDDTDPNNLKLLSTGTIVNYEFYDQSAPEAVVISGYSLPGVLEDCQIPTSAYPLQSINQTLSQIANRLCGLFNVKVIIYSNVTQACNEVIPYTTAKPDETVKDYLCKIASQKNVVVSHDIYGNLILFRPDPAAAPKYAFTDQNCDSLKLHVNGQEIHSTITCVRQPDIGDGSNPFTSNYDNLPSLDSLTSPTKRKSFKIGTQDTTTDNLVPVFRPRVERLTKGTFYNTATASQDKMASELQNIKVSFTLNHWEDEISIGDVVTVLSPRNHIYTAAKMVIDSTVLTETIDKKVMTGTLVLPETFTGNQPVNIFL